MVKISFLPGHALVAILAILSQLALVTVIPGVAAETISGRVTILLSGRVAGGTRHA